MKLTIKISWTVWTMSDDFVSSRFLIWDKPNAYPKYDLILRSSDGPVFDLGVILEDYSGSVYLRPEHVIEMGRTLGMATKEEVQALRQSIENLNSQIDELPNAQEELKNGINDAVGRFYSSLSGVKPPVVEVQQVAKPLVAEPEPIDSGSSQTFGF